MTGGKTLQWCSARIQDAVTIMPATVKQAAEEHSLSWHQTVTTGAAANIQGDAREEGQPTADVGHDHFGDVVNNLREPSTVVGDSTDLSAPSRQVLYVHSQDTLLRVFSADPDLQPGSGRIIALDCWGVPHSLQTSLIQVATQRTTYVLDCAELGHAMVCTQLDPLLASPDTLKLFHDVHGTGLALALLRGIREFSGFMDTQLAAELLWGSPTLGVATLHEKLGLPQHSRKAKLLSGRAWCARPLARESIEHAALSASLLHDAALPLKGALGSDWAAVLAASEERLQGAVANDGARGLCFDITNDYAPASPELLSLLRPGDMCMPQALVVESEVDDLVRLLPTDLQVRLRPQSTGAAADELFAICNQGEDGVDMDRLMDIVLDVGRIPHCWVDGQRELLAGDDTRLVQDDDLQHIVAQIGAMGSDNRAGYSWRVGVVLS